MHNAEIVELVKASPAIQIQSRITHLQRRAWNVLLANAYDELPNTDMHRISVLELAKSLGYESNNYEHLEETLEALVDCIVKWNVLGKDKTQEWGAAALLASVKIKNGVCTYSFAAHLRYKLYNPRIYTKLNLRLQNQFSSRYAVILWEVCFDYFDMARNEGETPFIPLDTFKEMVGVDEKEYTHFKELNRNIIKPAINEINELTNFVVEMETKRVYRSISELKFRITRMRELPTIQDDEPVTFDIEDLPSIAIKLVKAGVSRTEAIRIAEQQWKVVYLDGRPDEEEDFEAYVEEKIGMARQTRDIKNAGGFIVRAIQENYQDPVFQKHVQKQKELDKAAMLDSLREEMYEKKTTLIRQAVRANPELLEKALEHINSGFALTLLPNYKNVHEAYEAGVLIASEINLILAERDCADLVAPVVAEYEAEVARIENM